MGISCRQLRFRRWLSHDPAGYCEIATAPAEPSNDKSDSLLHPEGRKGKPESAFLPCHCEEGEARRGNLKQALTISPGLSCVPGVYCEIAPQGHFLALRAQGATAPLGPRNDKAGGFPHSSFFSLQDSFISVPLPYNTRLTALQNFPLSIFDFPRSPILFFSVFLYKN